MGSKVVVTYKRKRLFSRSDHSTLNLNYDKRFDVSDSKTSAKFDSHGESIVEHTLQNKDKKLGVCQDYCEDKVEENMLQCENRDSKDCAQEKSSNLSFVKSGSEHEVKCKDTFSNENNGKDTIPSEGKCKETLSNCNRRMEAASISGTFSSEEKIELNKDQCSSACDNLGTKRKLSSTLITFQRRCKRNKDNAANDIIIASECMDKCESVTPLAASCSVDVKNETKSPEKADNSCSFSAPAAAMAVHVDVPLHSPCETAENDPTTVLHNNSQEEISSLGEKVCMDVRDNRVRPQDLSNDDVDSKLSSLDLSISPPAYRDIDCNIPLDWDSDENHQPGPLETGHDSLGSTSHVNKNFPTSQVQYAPNGSHVRAVSDKGKFIAVSQPVKNSCIQLFPENKISGMHQLAHESEKANQLLTSSLQCSRIHNLSLHSEQINHHASYYSSLYEWAQLHPTESFPDILPSTSNLRANALSRHLTMLDNVLLRARGKFDFPATWSEEELDSLWIGVRRHGANNFESIIRDRRLHFSPWKTTRDLADRWRDEQYRLFHGPPVSQVNYATIGIPLPLGVQQNPLHECGARMRPPAHFTNLARNRQFQRPVTNGYLPKGNLPHWLREAFEIPPGPLGPARNVAPSVFCNPSPDWYGNTRQPCVNTRNAPVQMRAEPPMVMKRGEMDLHEHQANINKQDELIVINSDASSEETISDDHNIRG
ncbi:protein chromatin remodeling 4 [Phtheirospermum japonicum]|uniref:Protein chromatin remodeling 4 n=1 Tax=Phtheirospermum japonicum TaxID=374723 RepID=A0A830DFS1_9LAMI|nr:protein chromatin remodeling 4 [Phtheirospermum japonicum]